MSSLSNTTTTAKIKSISFPASDLAYIEAVMKSKGMGFSGAVRFCVAQSRASAQDANRLAQIEKKIDDLPAAIAGLFDDADS